MDISNTLNVSPSSTPLLPVDHAENNDSTPIQTIIATPETLIDNKHLPDSKEAKLPWFCLFAALISVLAAFENGWNTGVTNVPGLTTVS